MTFKLCWVIIRENLNRSLTGAWMKAVWMMLASLLFVSFAYGATGEKLVAKLGIDPASKAIKQWERVFTKQRYMVRLGIDKLSDHDKEILQEYLLDHAADSDQPTAAGL